MTFSLIHDINTLSAYQHAHLLIINEEAPLDYDFFHKEDGLFIKTLAQKANKDTSHHFSQGTLHHDESIIEIAILNLTSDDQKNSYFDLNKQLKPIENWLKSIQQEQVIFHLPQTDAENIQNLLKKLVLLSSSALYKTDKQKKNKNNNKNKNFFFFSIFDKKPLEKTLEEAIITANAIKFSKDLSNLPSNICTPSYLAKTARKKAGKLGVEVHIHNEKDIKKIGMNAFIAVAKGSKEKPYFIELCYFGSSNQKDAPIILVGKGITFDSGGISIKPSDSMDEMKYDMCGASTVLATFFAAVELELNLNLVLLIPTCENMPSGKSVKPGDIITSLEGLSIEVLNTDAEGRLILCDALSYANKQYKPKAIIDVATLTGACVVALGHVASGILGNNQDLIDKLLKASKTSEDQIWQLPLWDEYNQEIESNFADLANVGSRAAGTITAAAFLSYFATHSPWAHLDIAGTAWLSGKEKGATGRPIPLLLEYLLNESNN